MSVSKTAVNAKYEMNKSRSELRVHIMVISLTLVIFLCWNSKYSTSPYWYKLSQELLLVTTCTVHRKKNNLSYNCHIHTQACTAKLVLILLFFDVFSVHWFCIDFASGNKKAVISSSEFISWGFTLLALITAAKKMKWKLRRQFVHDK